MSANSSSPSNDSRLHLPVSSTNSSPPSKSENCIFEPLSFYATTSYSITCILLVLPLCIFILHHGLQHWKKKRSSSSASWTSHFDCFTYNMVTMELIGVLGCFLCCCGLYWKNLITFKVGNKLLFFTWYGELFFHVLTCVERYLAVVHPITYLGLRSERGVRIRSVTVGCVWLLCLGILFSELDRIIFSAVSCFFLFSAFIIIFFCSFSVLCVLIRPGPGEQGGNRERVDQSKQRAFYAIEAMLAVLVLRLVCAVATISVHDNHCLVIVVMSCGFWFNLPSSLVLPLWFLHKEGTFVCWKKNMQRDFRADT